MHQRTHLLNISRGPPVVVTAYNVSLVCGDQAPTAPHCPLPTWRPGAVAPEVGRDCSRLGRPHPSHPHLLTSSPLPPSSHHIHYHPEELIQDKHEHLCSLLLQADSSDIMPPNSVTSCSHKIIKRVNVSWLFCSTLGAVSLQFLCFKSSKSRLEAASYPNNPNIHASYKIIMMNSSFENMLKVSNQMYSLNI